MMNSDETERRFVPLTLDKDTITVLLGIGNMMRIGSRVLEDSLYSFKMSG